MASNHHALISHHAALVYVMVIVSAVDREMPDAEFRLIGRLSAQLPAFDGFDRSKLVETAQECAVILNSKDGLDRLLALVAQALSPELRETAYLVACEVAAHDRKVPLTEMALLEKIRRALRIDKLTAAALERATAARLAVADAAPRALTDRRSQ